MDSFLEEHKTRAFRSSFLEPARLYYERVGSYEQRDAVELLGFKYVGGMRAPAGVGG